MSAVKRGILFVIILSMIFSVGCINEKEQALVIGYDQFSGVFSPFFAVTDYDARIADLTGVTLLKTDSSGALTGNASEYITPQEIKNENGDVIKTKYTFRLVEGLQFSDGSLATADDIIFSFKVLCDPSYDGLSTISSLPIIGLNEYQYDDINYQSIANELEKQAENITDEELYAYILNNAQSEYEELGEKEISEYIEFQNTENLQGEQKKQAIIKAYADYELEHFPDFYLPEAQEEKKKALNQEYIQNKLNRGRAQIDEIAGIKKTDDKTVTVEIEGVSAVAQWDLGSVAVVPSDYYGKGENKAFQKGDLSVIKEKNGAPKGAGPYLFEKYDNNVVSLKANPFYFKGEPNIKAIKFQVVNDANKIENAARGIIDIADPMATKEALVTIKEKGLHYSLVENLGYGYIGINAKRITDINVRRGIMHLMNRAPAVDSYYGEVATVIERPLSKTSWAYPSDAKEVYSFNPQMALDYFKKAGYQQVAEGDRTVLKRKGQQLKLQVGIGGEGIMDHPSAPILTQMKIELEKMGAALDIIDCDMSLLADYMDAGEWDMWAASWGLTIDPDMYQKYHSNSSSNYYGISNQELDTLLENARQTNDIQARKEAYERCLELVMQEAVEMPVYQRMNLYVFNQNRVDITSLPKNMTAYYNYFDEIQNIKLITK